MKKYTIGIMFNDAINIVLLIKKIKPDWQKGKYNFPGGSIEEGETGRQCIHREFLEECGIDILEDRWKYIGKINNEGNYFVEVFTSFCYDTELDFIQSPTEEKTQWFDVRDLPKNIISNLSWLVPFAQNIWKQGNADELSFGTFEYKYVEVKFP